MPSASRQTGLIKTMYYNEGNPVALLVVNKAGRRTETHKTFPRAEGAMAWCRDNATILIYMPVNITHG